MITTVGIVIVAALAMVFLLTRSGARRGALSERAARPRALMDAELVFMEKLFRIRSPIPLVARVDRVYRLRRGSLVVMELKTRSRDRPYLTDVIQLSAQRLAIEVQTGAVVEPYAFVTVLGANRRLSSHRVILLDAPTLVALHARREAILSGQVSPAYAATEAPCRACAQRARCDRFRGVAGHR